MKRVFICGFFCLQAGFGHFASAETNQVYQLPTVTVQGDRASTASPTNQIDTTTLSGDNVRAGGISSMRDLAGQTPNVTVFDANNDRTPKFSSRGFRENNFSAGEPVMGVYVDGVPYFDLSSRGMPLFDVEQIEFLRGAQGTAFGAGGVGGVVNITTRQGDNDWHGHAGMSYGNYNNQNYNAGLSAPLVKDKLFLDLAGLDEFRDGFVHNNTLNTHPDSKETLAGRAQLRWTPSAAWSLSFAASGERFRDGLVPTFYPTIDKQPFSIFRNLDGFANTDGDTQSFKIGYDGDPVKFTSVSTHRDWKQSLLQDFDFSPFNIRNGFSNPELEQWSEEIRLQSPDDSDKFKWLGGLFFLDNRLQDNSGSVEFTPLPVAPPPAPPLPPPSTFRTLSHSEARTYALFGQGTYTVGEKLDLTAGVRLTYDEREMQRTRVLENAFIPTATLGKANLAGHFSDAQPKLSASWHFTPHFETYASVVSGYQSGGFNSAVDNPAQAQFNPARSWQFELGAKSSLWENKVTANAALFYTQTRNYQVYRISTSNPSQAFLLNADRASSCGAELELAARPTEKLELHAGLGYTHATFDDFFDTSSNTRFDGQTINFVPEFTANLSAKYHLPWDLYVRGDLAGVGPFYFDEANTTRQNAYCLVNLQAGYEIKNLEVYFFVKNVFDKSYANNALDLRNSFQPDLLIRQTGDPMTLGFAINARF